MGKRILIGSMLVLAMLLLMPSIPAIQQSSNETPNKPTPFPIIKFESFISLDINTTELQSPIPPGSHVVLPITINYWTDIPNIFYIIPWPLNILFLFHQVVSPMHMIFFNSFVNNSNINTYFSRNPVFTPIYFGAEKSIISAQMIITIEEDTPSSWYFIDIHASCYDIGRLEGNNDIYSIALYVEN